MPLYSKLELNVSVSSLPAGLKPYETVPSSNGMDLSATFVSPSSVALHVYGFYDGSAWRIRFAPTEAGAWSFSVAATDASGTTTWTGGAFTCVASTSRGFAQIKGKYLCYKDGGALFAIGHNTGWQDTVEQPVLADMADMGENMLSFWLAIPWAAMSDSPTRCAIENLQGGVGNYNQQACAYLDGVFSRAEAAGVYLLPSIWSHGQLRDVNHPWGVGSWTNNPYSTICSCSEFFKTSDDAGAETAQWHHQKNFLRYLIARWGYSQSLLGFVGVVEINGTTGHSGTAPFADKARAEAWCGSVRTHMASLDPFRTNTGGQYPLTFSKTDTPPTMPVIMDAAQWTNGGDLRGMDSYSQQDNNVAVSTVIAGETQAMRTVGPAIHSEFGGDINNGATQPTHLHNGIWAGTAAGSAMMPILWCDGGSFPMLTMPMRQHMQYLSQFMSKIDYLGDDALAALTMNTGVFNGWGVGLSDRGYFWIQNQFSGTLGGQTLNVRTLVAGTYRVYWYDVWTSGSTPLRTEDIVVDASGTMTLTVPALMEADMACRFCINIAPVASNASVLTKRNTSVDFVLSATDANEDALTYSIVSPPSGGLSGTAPNLTYTPNTGFSGTDSFTFKANDGLLDSNIATITIIINDPPTADAQFVTTDEDAPVTIALTATDPDNDALTYTVVTAPSHGQLSGTGSALTYTPDLNYYGDDSFTFKANDGHWDSSIATVSIKVKFFSSRPLVLRTLALKAAPVTSDAESQDTNKRVVPKDTLKLKAEIVLPDGIDLTDSQLIIGFVNADGGALGKFTETGVFQGPELGIQGGQFCLTLPAGGKYRDGIQKFSIKPVRKVGIPPNTYALSFDGFHTSLYAALQAAVGDLSQPRVAKVLIVVRVETFTDETLQYKKLAVVTVRSGGKTTGVKLTRR
ncbi:MAG: Ig-like domain-containing protein [Planctomycetota bacterium]|nr:Ig-like domain-containing protein [Planctomycetota bacterium]